MKTQTLVELERGTGQYGLPRESAIVDDTEHGRLLIRQAFGGMGSLRGGAYRWGVACKVPADATLASTAALEMMDPAVVVLEHYDAEGVMRRLEREAAQ